MKDILSLPLYAIQEAWKNKLLYNFDHQSEYFNLYIDSPFCLKNKCRYCCYNPTIIQNLDSSLFNYYYSDILPENISDYSEVLKSRSPSTVYFGGGTSSLASVEQLQKIFEELQKNFDFCNDPSEKTFEFNPLHLTSDKIDLLKEWKFTHITIGLQTFNKDILKYNRRKNPPIEDIQQAFALLEKTSIVYNVDIMTFIYRDNIDEDLAALIQDMNIINNRLLPRRLTVYPNYFKIDPPLGAYPSEETVEKIILTRKLMANFIANSEYIEKDNLSSAIEKEIVEKNYRYGFNLVRKDIDKKYKWKTYHCCGWPNKNKNQYVLGIGGFGKRRPISYFSDKFCYTTHHNKNSKKFQLVYADENY